MKGMKFTVPALCGLMLLSSCGMSNTGKGAMIGTTGGGALGAAIGAIIGKGKGAAIGAAVGAAVGGGAGTIIGHKMDKAKERAEAIANAKVEGITDKNGLAAVKVTFEGGILFASGKADLTAQAKQSLDKFANDVLKANTDMDVAIQGFTDNDKWKNSTAEQSVQKNLELSQKRAQSVTNYLLSKGVANTQIKSTEGFGEAEPVADNATAEGKKQNRRVEVYLYASEAMIKAAEAEAAK